MIRSYFLILFSFLSLILFAQDDETPYGETPKERTLKNEIGVDGYASVSTFGGTVSLGLKYALVLNQKFAFGPSFRYQRIWSKNMTNSVGFNIIGGGAFFHYRLNNVFFLGAELDFLKSPINYSYVYSPKQLIPTCFVGGGYSHEFENIGIRLNASVLYDVIDDPNSPFRASYVVRNQAGALVPIIYRVAAFFPLD